ncbi:MAG TPA: type II toxin-antitoxin system HigB family toxin [Gemmataceae bacterium]|nr:type II toxin-antitoxin system HigB family toxin [Gemmataceae bacterium]
MRLISIKKLRLFWANPRNPDSESSLRAWYQVVKAADWTCFADVRNTYNTADLVGNKVVFNIGGNKYRLVAVIDYEGHKVFVRYILNHEDYDQGHWKNDTFGQDWKARSGNPSRILYLEKQNAGPLAKRNRADEKAVLRSEIITMKTTRKVSVRRDAYLELIHRFPLRPIRSEEELDRAMEVVDELIDRDKLEPSERDYLDVLSDLTERYESETHPIEPVSDAAMLAHLIEAKNVTQADVAREARIAESTISEVLAGKRMLNRFHISKLSRYFNVSPTVFSFKD